MFNFIKPGSRFSGFRVLFGVLLTIIPLRFFYNGWIDEFYIQPSFHFSFYGFGWVKILPPALMYIAFGVMAVCGICIMLNKLYRVACIVFFLLFTYIELIDVTYYLNHYYLVSLLTFIMIFYNSKQPSSTLYNQRIIFFLKLQLSAVYFFGGINKIEPDWLLHAQPLRIWLFTHTDLPMIGSLLAKETTAFAIAWFALLFDICIPFLLWNKRTRLAAYIILSVFHITTAVLFNIGMFPWIMMAGTLLFFMNAMNGKTILKWPLKISEKVTVWLLGAMAVWQLLFPLRHLLYKQNYLWTEQGFRFAWNIMLIEKNASIEFAVKDADGKTEAVKLANFLTPFQIKMMGTQPDLIIQFAAYLKKKYAENGKNISAVYAECYLSLNGRAAQLYFSPQLNLLEQRDGFAGITWLYPLQ